MERNDPQKPCCEARSPEQRILRDLGYFGFFLHLHHGGRSGKQHILVRLLAAGGTMAQRELQESSPITSASLSELLAKLEGEGLVTRLRSQTDRRQLTIALTEPGRAKAREVVEARRAFEQCAVSCLTPEEVDDLADKLDRLADHWRALEKEKAPKKKGEAACGKN
ncbi:MarR family winged helix-turn-helix transcriptional regulator [Olsenella profusa]|uniref:MarR family transcriptional regulator n=1 Tax=Olsenella profusa TaxID=138595 RepID=A0ABS2F3I3_9ACTN|nr:MarR family transcriptional regulator [Olsenella profusa]MBM6775372.1 MarR family transcriptional regulator [Olsenella profusa]